MSDLNYTVSVTWMGYFVDDAIHKLLEKLLTNLSSRIDSLCLPLPQMYSPPP